MSYHGRCPKHTVQDAREDIARRGTATARGYGSKWQSARSGYLAKHPLCVVCAAEGRTTRATVVDHRIAWQRGKNETEQRALFWDSGNWAALCASHHSEKTARVDGSFGSERR
jgi:5-methylcytosine-specific restriction protein A